MAHWLSMVLELGQIITSAVSFGHVMLILDELVGSEGWAGYLILMKGWSGWS